jgi:hypothetical protein
LGSDFAKGYEMADEKDELSDFEGENGEDNDSELEV